MGFKAAKTELKDFTAGAHISAGISTVVCILTCPKCGATGREKSRGDFYECGNCGANLIL